MDKALPTEAQMDKALSAEATEDREVENRQENI